MKWRYFFLLELTFNFRPQSLFYTTYTSKSHNLDLLATWGCPAVTSDITSIGVCLNWNLRFKSTKPPCVCKVYNTILITSASPSRLELVGARTFGPSAVGYQSSQFRELHWHQLRETIPLHFLLKEVWSPIFIFAFRWLDHVSVVIQTHKAAVWINAPDGITGKKRGKLDCLLVFPLTACWGHKVLWGLLAGWRTSRWWWQQRHLCPS